MIGGLKKQTMETYIDQSQYISDEKYVHAFLFVVALKYFFSKFSCR